MHKSISFTRSVIDLDSKYLCSLCSVYNVTIVIGVVYVPPPYSDVAFMKVLAIIEEFPRVPILIVEDFNNYFNPFWDRFHTGSIYPGTWSTALWHTKFPTARKYLCYSSSYHMLSRIDQALGSLLSCGRGLEYLLRRISDYSPS